MKATNISNVNLLPNIVHNEYFLGGKENHNFMLDIQKHEEFKCRP